MWLFLCKNWVLFVSTARGRSLSRIHYTFFTGWPPGAAATMPIGQPPPGGIDITQGATMGFIRMFQTGEWWLRAPQRVRHQHHPPPPLPSSPPLAGGGREARRRHLLLLLLLSRVTLTLTQGHPSSTLTVAPTLAPTRRRQPGSSSPRIGLTSRVICWSGRSRSR